MKVYTVIDYTEGYEEPVTTYYSKKEAQQRVKAMKKQRRSSRFKIVGQTIPDRSPLKYPLKKRTNPKRGTTVPAHVRINPRTGRIQVFVTPKVAEKLRGGKGLRVAGNPGLAPPQGGASRIPVKLKYAVIDSTGKSHSATTKSHAKTLQKVLKVRGLTSKVVTLPKGSTTWNT